MPDQSFNYRKLGYVALNVADLERSVKFYRDVVGLDVTESKANKTAFLRCSDNPHDLIFYEGPNVGVKRIAFEMESGADLDRAREKLGQLNVPVIEVDKNECDDLRQSRAIRFALPTNGVPIELYSGIALAETPYRPTVAQILRLGHIVIGVKNFDASVRWLMDDFGFRASDYIKGLVAFLRCYPNPYHHSLGLQISDENQHNHIAFMVASIDDIGMGANRLKRAGAKIVFGPGRHKASGSIFLYFLDPDRMTLEYTFGMEEFSEHAPRAPRTLTPALETVDMWGGPPPEPEFCKFGIIEELT